VIKKQRERERGEGEEGERYAVVGIRSPAQ